MPQQRIKAEYDRLKTCVHSAVELPGPLWLFGAYVILKCTTWLNTLWIAAIDQNTAPWDWVTTVIHIKTFCYCILLIVMLRGLVLRRSYALPLVAWFAGIQFALCGLSLINTLRIASTFIPYQCGTWSASLLGIIAKGALWMLLLCYIERSGALARIFAHKDRHIAKKYILLLFVLILFQ